MANQFKGETAQEVRLKDGKLFKDLFEHSNEAIILHDRSGIILNANPRAFDLLGYDPERLLQLKIQNLHPKSELTHSQKAFQTCMKTGSVQFDSKLTHANGTIIDVEISASLIDRSNGIIQGIVRDIRKRKKLETRLLQSQKIEALGTLVAGVAHEINNPVNTIVMNAPLLEKIWDDFQPVLEQHDKLAPERKYGGLTGAFLKENLSQLIKDIDIAGSRIARIVRQLKDFAKKTNVSDKRPMQVNIAVENTVRMVQSSLNKQSIELEVNYGKSIPLMLGNRQSIEQVILNLILNGVQAIDHSNGKIEVTSGFEPRTGQIFIAVADNGRGVDPAVADKIFDPFFTDKQAKGGTGLGLSVSYRLIQAHQGEIQFESKPDRGTTFTVHMPTGFESQPARILVVDDDPHIRKAIIRALNRNRAYVIEEARSGMEALIRMGSFRPDLLILDIFMPEMNGVEVCKAIKQMPDLSGMKLLVITGFPDHPKLEEIVKMGYTHILEKPFEIKNLMKKVERILLT
jgi:PAS domain S-box-containing protein